MEVPQMIYIGMFGLFLTHSIVSASLFVAWRHNFPIRGREVWLCLSIGAAITSWVSTDISLGAFGILPCFVHLAFSYLMLIYIQVVYLLRAWRVWFLYYAAAEQLANRRSEMSDVTVEDATATTTKEDATATTTKENATTKEDATTKDATATTTKEDATTKEDDATLEDEDAEDLDDTTQKSVVGITLPAPSASSFPASSPLPAASPVARRSKSLISNHQRSSATIMGHSPSLSVVAITLPALSASSSLPAPLPSNSASASSRMSLFDPPSPLPAAASPASASSFPAAASSPLPAACPVARRSKSLMSNHQRSSATIMGHSPSLSVYDQIVVALPDDGEYTQLPIPDHVPTANGHATSCSSVAESSARDRGYSEATTQVASEGGGGGVEMYTTSSSRSPKCVDFLNETADADPVVKLKPSWVEKNPHWFERRRHWVRESNMAKVVWTIFIFEAIGPVAAFVYYTQQPDYVYKALLCRSVNVSLYLLTAYAGITVFVAIYTAYKLRKVHDAFGIKHELAKTAVTGIVSLVCANVFDITDEVQQHFQRAMFITTGHIFLFILFTTPVLGAYNDHRKRGRRGDLKPSTKSTITIDVVTHNSQNEEEAESESTSLADVICNPKELHEFMNHLKREFATENILFFLECRQFSKRCRKSADDGGWRSEEARNFRAAKIYSDFLTDTSRMEINLDWTLVNPILDQLQASIKDFDVYAFREMESQHKYAGISVLQPVPSDIFRKAASRVFKLMEHDSFMRFMEARRARRASSTAGDPSQGWSS